MYEWVMLLCIWNFLSFILIWFSRKNINLLLMKGDYHCINISKSTNDRDTAEDESKTYTQHSHKKDTFVCILCFGLFVQRIRDCFDQFCNWNVCSSWKNFKLLIHKRLYFIFAIDFLTFLFYFILNSLNIKQLELKKTTRQ